MSRFTKLASVGAPRGLVGLVRRHEDDDVVVLGRRVAGEMRVREWIVGP
jgi:hypothetical protein